MDQDLVGPGGGPLTTPGLLVASAGYSASDVAGERRGCAAMGRHWNDTGDQRWDLLDPDTCAAGGLEPAVFARQVPGPADFLPERPPVLTCGLGDEAPDAVFAAGRRDDASVRGEKLAGAT